MGASTRNTSSATMSANPQRAMMQFDDKLKSEARSLQKWKARYHTEPEVPCPTLQTATVAICVLGHPLNPDGSCSEILAKRLERAAEHIRLTKNSTVMIICGADSSMFPGAAPVTKVMHRILSEEYDIPGEQIFCRPDGLTTKEMADDVGKLLKGTSKEDRSPIGVMKLVTSDFNIVRARRCFAHSMHIYVSDDEVPSGLGNEDMIYMLDEEHRINKQYRSSGLYDADRRVV